MNRREFEALRDLEGKSLRGDIRWESTPRTRPLRVFGPLTIDNALNLDLRVNGTFKPHIPSFSFNFVVVGVGPICRIDVNGLDHRGVGRTHKHDLQGEDDPRNNLPNAAVRTDLERMSPAQVWKLLCRSARIHHEGEFQDPMQD